MIGFEKEFYEVFISELNILYNSYSIRFKQTFILINVGLINYCKKKNELKLQLNLSQYMSDC